MKIGNIVFILAWAAASFSIAQTQSQSRPQSQPQSKPNPNSLPQQSADDVFLEAPANSQARPPTDDLPPNEPPYTQTPDEVEAHGLIQEDLAPVPEAPKEKPKVVVERETDSDSGRPKIAHPDAKKGLYLIDQNTGRYYYKTKKISQKNQSTSVRIGTITPPSISTELGGNTYVFSDFYDVGDLPYLMLDYEWQPFRSFGKLGVVVGLGFFMATGNGRFIDPSIEGGAPAKEEFTFIGLPISAGGIYRFEFSDRQWLAPFISAGMSYYVLAELRDDNKSPKFVGTPAAYGGGGILFNITTWSKEIAFTMDREYGISNMWLALEYRTVQSLNKDLDVSSDIFNLGISVDY